MRYFNIVLATFIVLITAGLLIVQRVDVEHHQLALVGETEYQRGEIISSGDDFTEVTFAETTIYLDRNTEIKIIDGREGQYRINVIQGRVVVKGALEIQTRELITTINGTASFVHYSWLDEVDIANTEGEISTSCANCKNSNSINDAANISTLPPYSKQVIEFSPETSTAAEFYEWAL